MIFWNPAQIKIAIYICPPPFVPGIDSIDPDDAFSRVPYEKGSLFLYYLEGVVGGPERMTEWLRSYVTDFQYKTLETADLGGTIYFHPCPPPPQLV